MAEALCRICAISAERVLSRSDAGVVAVPSETVRPGHVMVVSASHAGAFSDLKPAEADAFMSLVASAATAVEQASSAERCYVLRIGDKSPHLHFHLVPRAEGEPSLAQHVFGGEGWAQHVRADAMPPAELVEDAIGRGLRLASIQRPTKEDPARLPAWLVSLAVSMLAGMAVFLALAPFTSGLLLTALPIGVMTATTAVVRERMAGGRVRWGSAAAVGIIAGTIAYFMIGWLRG
ncbi:MAG TPA: HIT family protein [Vicinamibacterales bacterium]